MEKNMDGGKNITPDLSTGADDLKKVKFNFHNPLNLDEIKKSGLLAPVISHTEARAQGLAYYWPGKPCQKGHHSLRRSDSRACWACIVESARIKNDRRKEMKKAERVASQESKSQFVIGVKLRNKFLKEYAQHGNLELAAKAIDLTLPEIQVQISKLPGFNKEIILLEERLKKQGLLRSPKEKVSVITSYDWDDNKRDTLIRVYVDTGDIVSARLAINCTASLMDEELERNEEFRKRFKEAEPKAHQALEERAIQLALQGNDKLIQLVLKAKKPSEYGDKIKVEQNTTVRVPDEQLNARITFLMERMKIGFDESNEDGERGTVIDVGGVEPSKNFS